VTTKRYIRDDTLVMAGEVANMNITLGLEVRTIVVEGDSFFCNNVLVSSYSHYSWLPKFSFLIGFTCHSPLQQISHFFSDKLPTRIIDLSRKVFSFFYVAM
jgi:hypothetical protein